MKINFPIVSIMFDDGLSSIYKHAFPILEDYEYKANIAINGLNINKRGFLGEEQIRDLLSKGWALSDHTYSHLNLDKVPLSVVKEEINLNRNFVQKMFGYVFKDFVFPQSRLTPSILNEVLNYYQFAFTGTKHVFGNKMISRNRLLHRTEIALYEIFLYGLKGSLFIKTMKNYLQKLAANKQEEWFIIFTHGVSDTPGLFDSPTLFFKSFLNMFERYKLPIVTTDKVLRFLDNRIENKNLH